MKLVKSLFLAAMLMPAAALAQQVLPAGTVIGGHLVVAAKPPTVANCTLTSGSTDMAGECKASATSGVVITFASAWGVKPFCVVTNKTTAADSAATISTTAITMGTTASNDYISWMCSGPLP